MNCAKCGKEFTGRKRKYCSKECCQLAHGSNPYYKPEPFCLTCGKPLMKGQKKYYSNACCVRAYSKRKGFISIAEYKENRKVKSASKYTKICKQCGNKFTMKRGGASTEGSGSFCSRFCYGLWRSNQESHSSKINGYYPGAQCKIYFKICEYCGVLYVSKQDTRRSFCCNDHRNKQGMKDYYCNQDAILAAAREKWWQGREKREPFECKECGKVVIPEYETGDSRRTEFCSVRCGKRYSHRARGNSHVARARCFGVDYEAVDPIKVFKRDGWRCQLCHKKLRRIDRGTMKDTAPELDHIIPLSKGGEHSYRNTQCACRKCNGDKGNQERGQLRMFG